jgi:hypothetical protein
MAARSQQADLRVGRRILRIERRKGKTSPLISPFGQKGTCFSYARHIVPDQHVWRKRGSSRPRMTGSWSSVAISFVNGFIWCSRSSRHRRMGGARFSHYAGATSSPPAQPSSLCIRILRRALWALACSSAIAVALIDILARRNHP